jgi:hypothetical protein
MKVNVKFRKLTAVDFEDRWGESTDKSFQRGQTLQNVVLEENVKGFWNICLENDDMIIGVPMDAIEIIS